jgi:hypothetical protein
MVADSTDAVLRSALGDSKRSSVLGNLGIGDSTFKSGKITRPRRQPVYKVGSSPVCTSLQDDVTNVTGCVKCLFTLLELYGLPLGSMRDRSFSKTVEKWLAGVNASGSWMKFVKWKFAAFFHYNSGNLDLPPPQPWSSDSYIDKGSVLCSGGAGRFANHLLNSPIKRNSFLASVLQLKKGCPRPSTQLVADSVKAAITALTSERKELRGGWLIDWQDMPDHGDVDFYLCQASMDQQCIRTVEEIFGGMTYEDVDRHRPIFPSTSASYQDTKAQGGSFRSIRKFAYTNGFCSLGAKTKVVTKKGERNEYKAPEPRVKFNVRNQNAPGIPVVDVDFKPVEKLAKDLYEAMLPAAVAESPMVKAIGLAESLKVRVITKGAPLTTKILHALQKFLHTKMRKHPVFQLIGKPVTAEAVQGRLGKKLGEFEVYVSGDYKSATDELNPRVSECIARAIARTIKLRPEEEELLIRSLTGNIFDSEGKHIPQAWGQLMGSIVSFIVLCIANAAMCRWSIEVEKKRKLSLKQTSLLINGDDVVFKTTMQGHKLWERITEFAGLSTSVGKTYVTALFAQINSVNFQRLTVPEIQTNDDGKVREVFFKQTDYINLGLLFGLKRSGEKVGKDAIADDEVTLGTRCRELVRCAPVEMRERVLEHFIRYHKRVLDNIGVPWFIPESYGGVGLPPLQGQGEVAYSKFPDKMYRFGPSDLNLRVAARLREGPLNIKGKPLYPVGRIPVDSSWMVHKAILDNLPVELQYGNPSEEEENVWSQTYATLCFDAFLSDQRLCKSSKKDDDGKSSRSMTSVLKRNSKSWSKALKDGRLPPPLSLKTLTEDSPPRPYLRAILHSSRQDLLDVRSPGRVAWRENLAFDVNADW